MINGFLPLVSCIMPTFDRRDFVPRAITYFQRQDYLNKQLIIVDDGTDPVADLIPPDERVQYIRLPQRLSVGAKRNLVCEQSAAPLIAHWDDDDWHAPQRLRRQVGHILNSTAAICDGENGVRHLIILSVEIPLAACSSRYQDWAINWSLSPRMLALGKRGFYGNQERRPEKFSTVCHLCPRETAVFLSVW